MPHFPNNVAFLAPSQDRDRQEESTTDWTAQLLSDASGTEQPPTSNPQQTRERTLQVSVLIRMPRENTRRSGSGPVDDDAAVQEEWEGTEVGLAELPVSASSSNAAR
jgi:hypothetical protein